MPSGWVIITGAQGQNRGMYARGAAAGGGGRQPPNRISAREKGACIGAESVVGRVRAPHCRAPSVQRAGRGGERRLRWPSARNAGALPHAARRGNARGFFGAHLCHRTDAGGTAKRGDPGGPNTGAESCLFGWSLRLGFCRGFWRGKKLPLFTCLFSHFPAIFEDDF